MSESCDALSYLSDNIFIRFGSKLYRLILGTPMGTNCVSPVADLFFFVCFLLESRHVVSFLQ